MEDNVMSAVGLLLEAQARANYHDDWERDFERLQQRADKAAFHQAVRTAAVRIVSLFRIPALRSAGTEAASA